MDAQNKKCTFKDHKDIDAISYCQDCKIYICNKCFNYHQGLFGNHSTHKLDNNNKEIFIDKCKEKNHFEKLEFFCKNHNQLCCVACISKLEIKGYGQHKDCDICIIENIKEEKKNKLQDNIKYLEDLSKNLESSIKELKILSDKIDEKKDELKLKIQNIFTKIRTVLNEREDELLSEVDNKYNTIFGNGDITKEIAKLPNKIKTSLEKTKSLDNEWNDNNKLSLILNNCINIENNIKIINMVDDNVKKYKVNNDINIEFYIGSEYFDNFIKTIKSLGKIYDKYNFDSLILKNKEEINKFYDLLSNKIKINNMKLLYRASKDSLALNNLKNKINNKSNLIFLFFTGNTRIFGSFIKAQITVEHDKYIKDEEAFVFSLNNNKIYKILVPELAIRFYDNSPLLVGNNGISNGFYFSGDIIYDKTLLNNPKVYEFVKNNELTEGADKFIELEIFEISNI